MAQEIDYSKLSDEELEKLAGAPAQQDVSQMSDEQLTQLSSAPQPEQQSQTVEIPPLVAGGATAAMLGVPAMEAAGTLGAASLAKDFLTSPQGKQLGQRLKQMVVKAPPPMPTPAEKWNVAMHGVKLPNAEMDQKHFDIGQGMKSAIGPGGELQGGSIRGGIMLNEADTKALQQREAQAAAEARDQQLMQEARQRMQSNRQVAARRAEGWNIKTEREPVPLQQTLMSKLKGKAATTALAYPSTFGVGYNAADMYNRLQQDNVPQAAIAGAGMVGSGASMIPKKGIRKAGIITAIGAPLLNAGIDYIQGRAEGGLVHLSGGGGKFGTAANIFDKGADFVKGFLESTPKKPNPLVGTRYETKNVVDLVPIKPGKVEDIKGAMVQANPWDDTSRGVQVLSVSGKPLTKPVETHGGQSYVRDPEHFRQNIGGASGKTIATRVQNRANEGSIEGLNMGGSGEVILMPSTMGQFSGNFAKPTWEIYNDLFKQAEPNKKTVRELSDRMRNTKIRGRMPFEFAPDLMTEDAARIFENNPDFRKAFVQMMQLKGNQKLIGANAEDISNAMADPNLLGVPRGFVGHTGIQMSPGAELRPSTNASYDTDWEGKYRLSLPHTPMQVMLKRRYDEILPEMQAMYPHKTPTEINALTLGALETRGKGVSELMDEEAINRIGQYHEGLKQGAFEPYDVNAAMEYLNKPGRYAEGGEVQHMADGKLTGYLSTLENMAQNAQDKAHRSWRETASMTPQEMAQTGWEAAKFAGSFNPLISAGLVGSQFIDAAKGNAGWGEAIGNAALNAPGVVVKAAKAAAPYIRPAFPYVGGLGALGMADAAEAAPKPSTLKGMMDDVVKGFAPKGPKEITPGAPHTYGPQATGSWVRDYQRSGTSLPSTPEEWNMLAQARQAAQNQVDYSMGKTGPVKPDLVQYWGKYRKGTPEERAAQRQSDNDTIRMLMKMRGMD